MFDPAERERRRAVLRQDAWDRGFRYRRPAAPLPPSRRMIPWSWFISRAKIYAIAFLVVMAVLFILIISDAIWRYAYAQDNHHLHHAQYQNWNSNAGYGCCDNKDCDTLDPARVRENGDHTEVLVNDDRGDQWCPVEFRHLVNQENGKRLSPDWTLDHACIIGQNFSVTVCERLKCFMEKGKF